MAIRRFAIWLVAICVLSHGIGAKADNYPHLMMGKPSNATSNSANKDDYLIEKETYALSYNNSKGTPNWVSWRLSKEDLGKAPRKPFKADSSLPDGFKIVEPKDYTGSGFDRGHMCPHSDRSKTVAFSVSTFFMTNMVPQSPQLNQKAWAQLELYCRDLVVDGDKVCYIVDGPAGRGGIGRDGFKTTIGPKNRRITVPSQCWKVILVLDADKDSPSKVDDEARLIAVIMPNDDSLGEEWEQFRVPTKEVEELTDLTFFDKAPKSVMDELKDERDEEPVAQPRHIIHGH